MPFGFLCQNGRIVAFSQALWSFHEVASVSYDTSAFQAHSWYRLSQLCLHLSAARPIPTVNLELLQQLETQRRPRRPKVVLPAKRQATK